MFLGLDFYWFFTSDVALFPCGIYMKIESLRLDLQLKSTTKKSATTAKENMCSSEKKKKKKPRNRSLVVCLGSPVTQAVQAQARSLGRLSPAWARLRPRPRKPRIESLRLELLEKNIV